MLAHARSDYTPPDPTTTGSVSAPEKKAEPAPPPVYQPPVPEPVSPTERALLEKLQARRDALKQRQDALDLREQMLKDAERKLESGVSDLKEAEEKAATVTTNKGEAEKAGLKTIVTMYETMKPKDAARVFDRLSLETLVPIVLAMNPRKMAEVLALMGSEPAERLTVALANRARGLDSPQTASAAPTLPPGELQAIDPGRRGAEASVLHTVSASARSIAPSSAEGFVAGAKRSMTRPSRPIRNFVKFHLIFCVPRRPGFSPLQIDVERVGARAVHLDLGQNRECHVVGERAEALDLLGVARLLGAELVAGKPQHHEAPAAMAPPQGFEPLILRGEAAFRGGVDHEQDLASVLRQRMRPAARVERRVREDVAHAVVAFSCRMIPSRPAAYLPDFMERFQA